MEQIRAMFEQMAKDGVFAEELQSLIKTGNAGAIVAAAKKESFAFTEADWQAYLKWSESLNDKKCDCDDCKEVAPDELENVTGGAFRVGSPSNPFIGDCWFHASGATMDNENGEGRGKCNQFACKALVGPLDWYQCYCWGTHWCVGNWHKIDITGLSAHRDLFN